VRAALTPDEFRRRFAHATVPDGGVVVELSEGTYWRLNRSASAFCSALETSTSIEQAATDAARVLGLPVDVATTQLLAVTSQLRGVGVRRPILGPFRYAANADGYDLWHGDLHVFNVDRQTLRIRLVPRPRDLVFSLFDYLRGLAPKLLGLRGLSVLHGAAASYGANTTGICGSSGAGKTTTATLLAKHGERLIAEDLLLLDLRSGEGPSLFLEGEKQLLNWCTAGARALSAPGAILETEALPEVASGIATKLTSLWFLDREQRGEELKRVQMHGADAMVHLLANGFLGSDDQAAWRRHLAAASAIASAVPAYELRAPDGIARLDQALERFVKAV
jgi:hypothetical protein